MTKNKKQFLISFLETIEDISDKTYQQRVWIEGKGPECDDFEEAADFVIGDGWIILNNYKNYDINHDQYLLLKSFLGKFEAFSDEHDWPQDFIDTPEWTKITEMAKEVLDAFHWKKISND